MPGEDEKGKLINNQEVWNNVGEVGKNPKSNRLRAPFILDSTVRNPICCLQVIPLNKTGGQLEVVESVWI